MSKFLLLYPDSHQEQECPDCAYVLHTETPRFLIQFEPGGHGEFMAIDPCADPALTSKLKHEASNFFHGE